MEANQTDCSKTTTKQNQNHDDLVVTTFGKRAIVNQNFSKLISLPKTALENLGKDIKQVSVELVQEKESKYIRLVPILTSGGETS
jgi:hypothetical protein